MSCFKKKFNGLAEAIITNAVITDAYNIEEGEQLKEYYLTHNACWDTGAQFTVISPRVVECLKLKPIGQEMIMGVGGDMESDVYMIHVGLPCGRLLKNTKAYCGDIDDYDILLGMDIITQTDFLISSKDSTTFSFCYPSQGDIELK